MGTSLIHSIPTNIQSKCNGKRRQLDETLAKTEAALMYLIHNDVKRYKNFASLARDIGSIVGVDPSLYRKRNTPHKRLFDTHAVKLCDRVPRSISGSLVSEETLQSKLSEAKRRIEILEKVLSDLRSRSKADLRNHDTAAAETDSFLRAFELTCQLVETILKEDQFLYFEEGRLMTRATMTAIPAVLSEPSICKPFLEWRHVKNNDIGSSSTADLEKSLRPSTERGGHNVD